MKEKVLKNNLHIITVTVTAPVGYKPRKSKNKLIICTAKSSPCIIKRCEEKAIKLVSEHLNSQNPDVDLKYTAFTETHKVAGCVESED